MVGRQPNDGEIRTGSYYRQHPGGASPGISETMPSPQDLEAGKQRVPHQGDVQGLRKSDRRRGDHHQEGPPEGEGDSTASFPIQLLNNEAQSSVPGGSGGGVAGLPGFPTVAATAPSNILTTANSSIREDSVASGSHRGHRSNGVRSLDSLQEAPSGQRATGSKDEPALISPGLRHNMVGHLKRNHGVWQELHALLTTEHPEPLGTPLKELCDKVGKAIHKNSAHLRIYKELLASRQNSCGKSLSYAILDVSINKSIILDYAEDKFLTLY